MAAFCYFEEHVTVAKVPSLEQATRRLQIINDKGRLYLQVGDRNSDAEMTRLWLSSEQAEQFGKGVARAMHDLQNGDD